MGKRLVEKSKKFYFKKIMTQFPSEFISLSQLVFADWRVKGLYITLGMMNFPLRKHIVSDEQ